METESWRVNYRSLGLKLREGEEQSRIEIVSREKIGWGVEERLNELVEEVGEVLMDERLGMVEKSEESRECLTLMRNLVRLEEGLLKVDHSLEELEWM